MILALFGAGAMGREFRMIAEESGEWTGIVFIDDHAKDILIRYFGGYTIREALGGWIDNGMELLSVRLYRFFSRR